MATKARAKLPKGFSIKRQDKDGTLYAARTMFDGKSYCIYGRELKQLQADFEELKVQLRNGSYQKESKARVKDVFEDYITYAAHKNKERTITLYRENFKFWKNIENSKIANVTPAMIQKILDKMASDEYSQSVIDLAFVVICNVFSYAVKSQLITKDPTRHVFKPQGADENHGIALTREQQALFVEACKGNSLGDFYLFDLETGMRGGELSGLQWQDIDFQKKLLHVQRTMVPIKKDEAGNTYRLDAPKSAAGDRMIPLTDTAMKILKARYEMATATGEDGVVKLVQPTAFVFLDKKGNPICRATYTRTLKRIEESIREEHQDFPDFTMHSLRHTAATRLAENGMNLQALKGILGHSSLSMTADLYSHIQPEWLQQEMARAAM